MTDVKTELENPKRRRRIADHLLFWFVMAAAFAFAGFDVWAQINERGIYAPEQETGQ